MDAQESLGEVFVQRITDDVWIGTRFTNVEELLRRELPR